MGEFSLTHIIIVLVIFLIFFGPKRLPQLGSSLGEAIRGFKNAMNTDHGVSGAINPEPQPPVVNQQAAQIPPQFQNPAQNPVQNPYGQTLRDAPAQHTTDVHEAQPAHFTSGDDKNRNGQS